MNNTAIFDLVEQIKSGLDRRAATLPSRWSNLYVKIENPKTKELLPYSYQYHPWTVEMVNTDASWVGPKAAQMGYTQSALIRALFLIDVKKTSVLYLLPKKSPDATDFSKSRFDPLIEQSPHLKAIFNDVNNIGHKKAGPSSLFIRGMRSKSGVKSLPVGCVVFDEFDEMVASNVAQAEQRMAGQFDKQNLKISTPTVPKKLIDAEYRLARQEHYFFRCPRCSRLTELTFPDSLVLYTDDPSDAAGLARSHYRCPECKGDIYHEEKSDFLRFDRCEWAVVANRGSAVRGFHINQYYSFTETPATIAKLAILARSDPDKQQEYHNSVGGQPIIPEGSGINEEQIKLCLGEHELGATATDYTDLVTMGVDVGKVLHYEICLWRVPPTVKADVNTAAHCTVIAAGTVEHFSELDSLMRMYQITMCVIDANPEARKATEFANRFPGYVWMCWYGKEVSEKTIVQKEDQRAIRVNRTTWLDTSLGRFRVPGRILLPINIGKEYKDHLQSIIKRYVEDTTGNRVARYQNFGADHFAHARNYAEIALPLAAANFFNRNITDLL